MKMLSPYDLPEELWNGDNLHLPSSLQNAYWSLLEKNNLTDMCSNNNKDDSNIYGGRTREETMHHFAKRYGVSSCRVESLVIDPHGAFQSIPDDILSSFSEGRISLLDLPCGTGAVGASILSTVSTLRSQKKIPKEPLDVYILGGDYSKDALNLYSDMMKTLDPAFKSVGINVSLDTKIWEAEQSHSTSQLFDMLYGKAISEEYIVVIANFAGALSNAYFTQCEDSLKHIFDRTSNKKCTIIWVESKIKSVDNLFGKLLKRMMTVHNPWYEANKEDPLSHDYSWYHPFLNQSMPCRVTVKKYRRY